MEAATTGLIRGRAETDGRANAINLLLTPEQRLRFPDGQASDDFETHPDFIGAQQPIQRDIRVRHALILSAGPL